MQVCYVLNQFPELSQTFVLRQVVDLLRRGHDVDIIAARMGKEIAEDASLWAAADRALLQQRTRYTRMPENLILRALQGLRLGVAGIIQAPGRVATALDVRRFGWFAATGSLLAMGLPLERSRSYDALIAHFGPQGVLAQGLREMGVLEGPLVTFFHAYDLTSAPRRVGRGMYERLFECGDLHLAISQRGAALLRELGAPSDRVGVHHMGVDVQVFSPAARARSVGDPDRPFRIVSIGRLVAKKGFDVSLRAVARARARGVPIDYSIYGSGPLDAHLRRLIEQLGLRANARLEGAASRSRLVDALNGSDVLVSPSVTSRDGDEEGIPMVLMEAMASGLPVVATRTGAVAELVEADESGLLVREGDADGLCDAMCRLREQPELARRLAHAGRERVLQDFNEAEQGRRLVTLVSTLREKRVDRPACQV